jgi:hypothetical protein
MSENITKEMFQVSVLVMSIARTLVANGVVCKEDLLADLGRQGSLIPGETMLAVRDLISLIPDR